MTMTMTMNRPLVYLLLVSLWVAPGPGPRPSHAAAPGSVLQVLPGKGRGPGSIMERPAGPPLSLTASDGSGLQIVSLVARAVVEDPLAFTELHLVFRNPQPRQIEGQFEITLPPGAAISRFAMRQPQGWQEGEVVELQAARAAYEDFLHRRQDPALLEKQAGNQFHARVFPIPPSGEKELVVSFSQERTRAADPFRIYLAGLPRLERLELRALVGKSEERGGGSSLGGTSFSYQTVEVKKTGFTPDRDFEVAVPTPDRLGLRHQNLVVARIAPVTQDRPEPMGGAVVLFDSSASRALGYREQVQRLGQLVALLGAPGGGKLPVKVLCFDQEVEEIYAGPAGGFGGKELGRILERRALGASDLGKALRAAAGKGGSRGYDRVVLLTDGIATAGPTEGPELRRAAQALREAGVRRLDAVAQGGIRDEAMLAKLVTAGLQSDGVVADGDGPAAEIARKLRSATYSGIKVQVPGAQWVWPEQLDGVQAGDQVLVYADLPREQPFAVVLDGAGSLRRARQAVTLAEVQRPLLERAWVGARIRRILHQRDTIAAADPDLREGLRRQIIELSTRHRVLSDFTALLVLETEADYARFHIDRRSLTDILTVGAGGIELVNRRAAEPIGVRPLPPQPVLELAKEDAGRSRGAKKEAGLALKAPPAPAGFSPPSGQAGPATGESLGGAAAPPAPAAASPAPVESMTRMAEPERAPPPPRALSRPRPAAGAPAMKAMAPRRAPLADAMDGLLDERRVEAEAPRQRALAPAAPPKVAEVVPYEGKLLEIMSLLRQQRREQALHAAQAWRDQEPGDVLALIGLGEALEALGQKKAAARAYGSLIDLFPGRADLRRFAGERLERLGADGLPLAVDSYTQAREQRPDHPASHRLLAYALLRAGRPAAAFDVIGEGARRPYPPGRFAGVPRILAEDAGLIAAAWIRKEPAKRSAILERLAGLGGALPSGPSLRFVLAWETDANDVDFHIYDGRGGHAYYSSRALPSGGELYADVTTGYGPECFTIEGTPRAYPYRLQAHYYSRGPMGYGMGKLEIVEHDGKGGLRFAERPFVIMKDGAFVDLGQVTGPLPAAL